MDQQVLNDIELIELVRKILRQVKTEGAPNKSLILLSEFAREQLRQRVLSKVEFVQLLDPKK